MMLREIVLVEKGDAVCLHSTYVPEIRDRQYWKLAPKWRADRLSIQSDIQ